MADAIWPKTVPILSDEHIFRGYNDGPRNQHCLNGWLVKVFFRFECFWEAAAALSDNCEHDMVSYNDDTSHSKQQIAAKWNKTMRQLGYTEAV